MESSFSGMKFSFQFFFHSNLSTRRAREARKLEIYAQNIFYTQIFKFIHPLSRACGWDNSENLSDVPAWCGRRRRERERTSSSEVILINFLNKFTVFDLFGGKNTRLLNTQLWWCCQLKTCTFCSSCLNGWKMRAGEAIACRFQLIFHPDSTSSCAVERKTYPKGYVFETNCLFAFTTFDPEQMSGRRIDKHNTRAGRERERISHNWSSLEIWLMD